MITPMEIISGVEMVFGSCLIRAVKMKSKETSVQVTGSSLGLKNKINLSESCQKLVAPKSTMWSTLKKKECTGELR